MYETKYIKQKEKIKQNRTGTENFDTCFTQFFTAIAKFFSRKANRAPDSVFIQF